MPTNQLNAIPVFFRPEMTAANVGAYSPSAAKPAKAVADWQTKKLPIDIRSFAPASVSQIKMAHQGRYVDDVLEGREPNGFGNTDGEVAASLPYTTGAMLAAAREALHNGAVACAPVSGFHHACHSYGGGFCTFNGLMVTALALKAEGLLRRVAILDLDFHWGDGTDDIISTLGLDWVVHSSPKGMIKTPGKGKVYLEQLPELMEQQFADCDLLLYQAGADAHIEDPLGGWMNSEQLSRRDAIVFEMCKRMGLPVAWNLAGGYQRDASGGIEPVLAIHRATMRACAQRFVAQE